MMSIFFGLAALGLGLWGVMVWRRYLIVFLLGAGPVSLAFAGFLAVLIGISSLRSRPKLPLKKDHVPK